LKQQPSTTKPSEAAVVDPGANDDEFTDGRQPWDWRSKYRWHVWLQICLEGAALIGLLGVSLYGLAAAAAAALPLSEVRPRTWLGIVGLTPEMVVWASVALGGMSGGCANSLKWLYHGVAHGKWHRDRIVWRMVVPILSATLALFTALMIGSGIVPIFSRTVFDNWKVGAAFGFFVGFFSDNLVASLQRLATQTLGTLEKPKKSSRE
jgi:hypothetical protein